MADLLYPQESKRLFDLAHQLHKELGCGFKEKVYQDAFEVLLQENNIPYVREAHLVITYHGRALAHDFFWDFLCYGTIGVEVKALQQLDGDCESQVINYLHAGKQRLGFLINFGTRMLEYKWIPNHDL